MYLQEKNWDSGHTLIIPAVHQQRRIQAIYQQKCGAHRHHVEKEKRPHVQERRSNF